jgi:hypothetical protein
MITIISATGTMKEEHPLIRLPTQSTRMNLFDVLSFSGLVMEILLGSAVGHAWLGVIGAIVGGIIGGVLGLFLGHLPGSLAQEQLFRSMQKKSNAELKAVIDEEEWTFIQTLALLNLHLRDEDVQGYLPRVITLLESDHWRTRLHARDALRFVCTPLAVRIEDYDPYASTEKCRRKVAVLHEKK